MPTDDLAGAGAVPGNSILETVGVDIVRIVSPVSFCMLLVVLLVSSLGPFSLGDLPIVAGSSATASPWDDLKSALLTSLAFVAFVTVITFLLVLLFYCHCGRFLKAYLVFSTFVVLLLLGAEVAVLALKRLRLPLDAVTFSILFLNFAAVGAVAVLFPPKFPISINQAYLIAIGVLTAYWFTLLPEWTTWALLIAMSLYDLAAVLLPGGPLRLLVELAVSRNEEIPALVYEARPVNPPPAPPPQLWRDPTLAAPLLQTRQEAAAEEEEQEDAESGISSEGIGLGWTGAIKLGLGDFIFYSVLVGRAAMHDYAAVYACYLAVVAGLGVTLAILAGYRRPLPALPVSIGLGVLFYVLATKLLELFLLQCSVNLLMF